MRDLAALRREYADEGLTESDLDPDPVAMFRRWFDEVDAAGVHEPNAMVVATVSADGQPSSRMVLLKGVGDDGFVFFTNTASRKGEELAANPRCSLLFPWHPLERQVRIDGTAEPLSHERVTAYFDSRPRGSRIGAHASHQSRPVAGRAELQAAYDELTARYDGLRCRCPRSGAATWCGPRRSSSGRGGPAGCTTGSSTAGRSRVTAMAGGPRGSPPDRAVCLRTTQRALSGTHRVLEPNPLKRPVPRRSVVAHGKGGGPRNEFFKDA